MDCAHGWNWRREVCPECAAAGMVPLAIDWTAKHVDDVIRENETGKSAQQLLALVMRRSKGSANPTEALRLIHLAKKGGGC